jgi:hypothetical protein
MQDTRWSDPEKLPLSNGPFVQTTPPLVPKFRLSEDGHLFEFLLPFPIHLVDDQPWTPLQFKLGDRFAFIEKPVFVAQSHAPSGRIGNEVSDAFCTVVRVSCPPDTTELNSPKQCEIWLVIERLLRWIRVKARHYWLLHGHAGFGTLYRGSVMTQLKAQLGQRNFATYGCNLIVRPLDQDLWLTFADEINSGSEPPVAESIFCDAVISTVAGDEVKAVLELGVAVEIETTRLLAEVSRVPPKTAPKVKFAAKGERDKFYEKLEVWPKKLGLQEAQSFDPTGRFPRWFELVKELYKLRGHVAHSGKLALPSGNSAVNYLMAANVLFAYSREQRRKAGVGVYSYPASRSPFNQIVSFRDGQLSAETNTASSSLSEVTGEL